MPVCSDCWNVGSCTGACINEAARERYAARAFMRAFIRAWWGSTWAARHWAAMLSDPKLRAQAALVASIAKAFNLTRRAVLTHCKGTYTNRPRGGNA